MIEARARQAMRAMLTPEQVRRYQTDASFKATVDFFFMQIVPAFLSGAEAAAEKVAGERAELLDKVMRTPSAPILLDSAQFEGNWMGAPLHTRGRAGDQ